MSKLKIHSVDDKGVLAKECIWLNVLEDVTDLDHYIICDTTYTNDHHVSNELRHIYWFKKKTLKKGDWIRLMTKDGTDTAIANDKKTITHTFHWKLGKTVWNQDGDTAVLIHFNSANIKHV